MFTSSSYSSISTNDWVNSIRAVPTPPTSVNASDGDFHSRIEVSWSSVSGATHYNVFRCSSTSTSDCVPVGGATTTFYADFNVNTETYYIYRIRACNSEGCSDLSDLDPGFCVSAPPSKPYSITASDGINTDTVEVTWKRFELDERL